MKSLKCYAVKSAPLWLFLMVSLTGCGNRQTQYEAVKVKPLPIPSDQLTESPVPFIPKPLPYGDAVLLIPVLLGSIDQCNGKIRTIAAIEENRSKP